VSNRPNSRRRRPRRGPPVELVAQGRELFILPRLDDDAPPNVKQTIATRRAASVTGRCACGADAQVATILPGVVYRATFEHEHGCPAVDGFDSGDAA
jgi:hypothetical protein